VSRGSGTPPGHVEAMQKMLTGAGVAEDAIRTERLLAEVRAWIRKNRADLT
jgi:hypothetical protein